MCRLLQLVNETLIQAADFGIDDFADTIQMVISTNGGNGIEEKRSAALFAGMSVCRLLIWVLAAWILIKAGKSAYSFGYQVFAQKPVSSPPGKNVSCDRFGRNDRGRDIGKVLKNRELIRDAKVFQRADGAVRI